MKYKREELEQDQIDESKFLQTIPRGRSRNGPMKVNP